MATNDVWAIAAAAGVRLLWAIYSRRLPPFWTVSRCRFCGLTSVMTRTTAMTARGDSAISRRAPSACPGRWGGGGGVAGGDLHSLDWRLNQTDCLWDMAGSWRGASHRQTLGLFRCALPCLNTSDPIEDGLSCLCVSVCVCVCVCVRVACIDSPSLFVLVISGVVRPLLLLPPATRSWRWTTSASIASSAAAVSARFTAVVKPTRAKCTPWNAWTRSASKWSKAKHWPSTNALCSPWSAPA